MNRRFYFITFFVGYLLTGSAHAQSMNFKDTIYRYNQTRILTNVKGLQVLAGWGAANVVSGGIGYFTAKSDEWKYFHEMNAIWGVANTGIALYGISRARHQAKSKFDMRKAYDQYRKDKRILRINIGLDLVYAGAGALMINYAASHDNNKAMYQGFGTSLLAQGLFLMAFDNLLLLAHDKQSIRWARILDEMRITGSGFSYVHTFPTHSRRHQPHPDLR